MRTRPWRPGAVRRGAGGCDDGASDPHQPAAGRLAARRDAVPAVRSGARSAAARTSSTRSRRRTASLWWTHRASASSDAAGRPDLRRDDRARHLATQGLGIGWSAMGGCESSRCSPASSPVRRAGGMGDRLEREPPPSSRSSSSACCWTKPDSSNGGAACRPLGKGHGRRLFVLIVLLGAAVSALFANDGAALILTPIVIAICCARWAWTERRWRFVMAAGFVADTASLPLVVSNLVNIVSADVFGIGFRDYAAVMVPVDLVSIAATLGALLLFFGRDIPQDYDVGALRARARRSATLRPSAPEGSSSRCCSPASSCSNRSACRSAPSPRPARSCCWRSQAAAMSSRRRGAARRTLAGRDLLAGHVSRRLRPAQRRPDGSSGSAARPHRAGRVWGAALGTGVIAALLSSLMNNMPTVLVGALSIDATHATGRSGRDDRQRHRVRPRPQSDADRLARDPCCGSTSSGRRRGGVRSLGLLSPGRGHAHRAGPPRHPRGAGAADRSGLIPARAGPISRRRSSGRPRTARSVAMVGGAALCSPNATATGRSRSRRRDDPDGRDRRTGRPRRRHGCPQLQYGPIGDYLRPSTDPDRFGWLGPAPIPG